MPYGSTEGKSAHMWVHSYLPLVDDFANVLRTVDCSLYRSFFRSSTSIIPGQFVYPIPQRMAAEYSFLHSSTAFTTVFVPYFSADVSGLLLFSLVHGFHDGLRAVLLRGWLRIAPTSTRQRLSRRFGRRIAQRMAADFSYFHSSKAFTTDCVPYCSANGSGLLILPLVNSFHNGLRAVIPNGWQRIAHSFSRYRLSRRFVCGIAHWISPEYSFFHWSMAFTVCSPFCPVDGSILFILPLVNGFHSLHTVLLCG